MFFQNKYLKASILGILIFLCFNAVFLQKQKAYVLSGNIASSAPVELTANLETSRSIKGYTQMEHVVLTQNGSFELVLKANRLYGLALIFKTDSPDFEVSDLSLRGQKLVALPLADNAWVHQKNLHKLEFKNISFPNSKRFYTPSPWIIVCFIPLLCAFFSLKKLTIFNKYALLFLPLFLLCLIKYFAFEHPFNLFYNKVNLLNIFYLEKHDFSVFACLYGILAIMLVSKARIIRFFCWVALAALLSILIIDGVVLHNLDSRFLFSEAKNYKSEYVTAFYMLVSYLGTIEGRLMSLCCLVIGYIACKQTKLFQKKDALIAFLTVVILVALNLSIKTNFLFDYHFYSVFKVNEGNNQSIEYSQGFKNKVDKSFHLSQNCVKGLNKRKNIIVIIAESLSSYTSKELSNLHNYMPRLDKLMKEYAVYPTYYSNSYMTNGGIFSLLSGLPYIHIYKNFSIGTPKTFYKEGLPAKLKKSGYKTYFYTNVRPNQPLQEIVYNAAFDIYSDFSDPYYKNTPALIFDAPADEVLFENVLNTLSLRRSKKPYLMVISTISGHGPYIHPETKEQSFEKVVDYVDEQIDNFITQLDARGFFKNGMVVITGDHRAMRPVSNDENQVLAPLAEARVPLVIIDKDLKGRKSGVYSHNDLAPSLQYYLTKKGCFNPYQNNLFKKSSKNKCIIFQQASPSDQVNVLCDDTISTICLNGDETTYCSEKPKDRYVDFINWLRVEADTE